MSREDSQMKIRLPDELKERIEAAAVSAKRSLNAEIVARLEETFSPSTSSASLNALALRLAETELKFRMLELESKVRLIDAHYASEVALEFLEFNKSLGYETPPDPEAIKQLRVIYSESEEEMRAFVKEDFDNTIKALEAAKDRLDVLKSDSENAAPRRVRIARKEGDDLVNAGKRVVLVGNIGRAAPKYEEAVHARTESTPSVEPTQPGKDVGSQHRPPPKRRIILKGSKK